MTVLVQCLNNSLYYDFSGSDSRAISPHLPTHSLLLLTNSIGKGVSGHRLDTGKGQAGLGRLIPCCPSHLGLSHLFRTD